MLQGLCTHTDILCFQQRAPAPTQRLCGSAQACNNHLKLFSSFTAGEGFRDAGRLFRPACCSFGLLRFLDSKFKYVCPRWPSFLDSSFLDSESRNLSREKTASEDKPYLNFESRKRNKLQPAAHASTQRLCGSAQACNNLFRHRLRATVFGVRLRLHGCGRVG